MAAGAFCARNLKDVRKVVTKGSVACGAEACANFWVCGCSVLTRVDGVNALRGVVQIQHASNPCTDFGSIDLRGLKAPELGSATYGIGACSKLKTILMDQDWSLRGAQIFDVGARWGAPRPLWRREGLTSSRILCR